MLDDALRTALTDLRDSAAPHVKPPGLTAVEATVRRRQNRRAAAASALVSVITAGLVLATSLVATPPVPTPTPAVTDTGPTPSPTPTAPASNASDAPGGAATG